MQVVVQGGGGGGGLGNSVATGGAGAKVTATLSVSAGASLSMFVGGGGAAAVTSGLGSSGGGGGGSSSVSSGSDLIVAGGGGGGGNSNSPGGDGGRSAGSIGANNFMNAGGGLGGSGGTGGTGGVNGGNGNSGAGGAGGVVGGVSASAGGSGSGSGSGGAGTSGGGGGGGGYGGGGGGMNDAGGGGGGSTGPSGATYASAFNAGAYLTNGGNGSILLTFTSSAGSASTNTIPGLNINVSGVVGGPTPLDMSQGSGPAFMKSLVTVVSAGVRSTVQFVRQTSTGTVVLQSADGRTTMAVLPFEYQANDNRADGLYEEGYGRYRAVANGQSVALVPAVLQLDQLLSLSPAGSYATIQGNGAVWIYEPGGVFVLMPSLFVGTAAATGVPHFGTNSSVLEFIDAQGNSQYLNRTLAAPGIVARALQESIGTDAQLVYDVLNGRVNVRVGAEGHSLWPEYNLSGIPGDKVGQFIWKVSDTTYAVWVTLGRSQQVEVRY